MAHFAKIDADNKVVAVHAVANDTATDEQAGVNFLNNLFGTNDNWKQTSYNTDGGVHKLGGTPFRKNYAGVGDTYDADRDAFIPKKLFPSWVVNDTTCQWEPPVANPNDGKNYRWNEDTTSWDEISL
jgi:hypothetical protein